LANDGVVYAEIRFAPELHVDEGLSLDEVAEATLAGFSDGSDGRNIRIGTLVTAMRHAARSVEIAELAVRHRDHGVVGFDIAGSEAGNPPTRHLDAFQYIHRENFHITIHAGEAYGPPSIWEAIQYCGTERLGHGVRIMDDITSSDDGHELGRLAAFVRDTRIPLEICPSSNVHTGAAASIANHPIKDLVDLRYRVTMNTDNRLMSATSMSNEFDVCCQAFDWDWHEVQWLTINAMKSSFIPFDERLEIINRTIKPWYASRTMV
jgi:adenosine deaminase